MAIEGITGAASTYQAASVTKIESVKPVESAKVTTEYGRDGSVSEIAKDTNVVKAASDRQGADNNGNGKNERQPSEETVKQTISDVNRRLMNNTECRFGVHEKTNRVTIQIVDKDTQEVVKELPPEKTLDMIAKAWELAGILVDEKL